MNASTIRYLLFLIAFSLNFFSPSFSQVAERDNVMFTIPREFHSGNHPAVMQQHQSAADTLERLPYILPDFMVNSLEGEYGATQGNPALAVDSSGTYAVAWVDLRNGQKEIYAQFFNGNDEPLGENILVSELPNYWNSAPAVASNQKGDFIIAWAQGHDRLLAQRFTRAGVKVGGNFQLNDLYAFNTMEPSIAVSENGSFLAVWSQDVTGGGWNTYARMFDSANTPVGISFVVNDVYGNGATSIGWGNRVAVDEQGNFVVVWSANSNNLSKIYLQKIAASGQKIGQNVMVSDMNDFNNHYFPSVAAAGGNRFLIVWQGYGVHGRIYDFYNGFVTGQFTVFSSVYSNWYLASAASDWNNLFLINWSGGIPLMCREITIDGQFTSEPVVLTSASGDTLIGSYSHVSNIVANQFHVVFTQYHRSDQDIGLQKYETNFTPWGALLKVNDDLASSWQYSPLTYFNHRGEAIILWQDQRHGRYDLFGQVYDRNMNPVGNDFQINDARGERWFLKSKAVCAFSDGTFLVAFTGSNNSFETNVYLQKISTQGEKIGTNTQVKETHQSYKVAVNIDAQDVVLLCWYNSGLSLENSFLQEFEKTLVPISQEKPLNFYQENTALMPFALSVNSNRNLFITWLEHHLQNNQTDDKIYYQFYNAAGIAITPAFGENIQNGENVYTLSNASTDSANFVIAWADGQRFHIRRFYGNSTKPLTNSFVSYGSRGNTQVVKFLNHKVFATFTNLPDVYGFFINDNRRLLRTFLLHRFEGASQYWDPNTYANSSDMYQNELLFSYASFQNGGTGYDIWANVQDAKDMDFDPEPFFPPVDDDVLYQNFPNPFNSTTRIVYEILAPHRVTVTIYDVLGREVRVLRDEFQEKGLHDIVFNASDLPSGIYYCKLKAFRTRVIKLLLIK